jgi:hypothetical protein
MHVLVVISIYNYYREVEPVVACFAARGARVTALLGWRGATADEAARHLTAVGAHVASVPGDFAYGEPTSGGSGTIPQKLAPSPLARLARLPAAWRAQRRLKAWARDLFAKFEPDVVLQGPYHGCGTFDQAIAAVRKERRVPALCYPVSAYHGRKGPIMARFSNLARGMLGPVLRADLDWINAVAARLMPHWTQTRDGQTIFMFDPLCFAVSAASGLGVPRDVWQKPDVDFDRVCVFTAFSAGLLRDSAFPMDSVRVVGIPLLDSVAAAAADPEARAALYAELDLPEDAPFLLFNVEPSAEHHYADQDTHWRNFRATLGAASSSGLPVVLSLHPLCAPADYEFAQAEFGARIARRHKIYDLYPHCRVAVSFACSTNVVAELFGKPLVIYDYFDMVGVDSVRAAEFRLPGAHIAHDPAALAAAIAAALAEPLRLSAGASIGSAAAAIYAEAVGLVAGSARR